MSVHVGEKVGKWECKSSGAFMFCVSKPIMSRKHLNHDHGCAKITTSITIQLKLFVAFAQGEIPK